MSQGQFFEKFFSERGDYTPNTQHEVSVFCPFPHDKGYETRPSAHVNVQRGVFHCKTCRAEGRFKDGGLSEPSFVSALYNIPYEEALEMIERLNGNPMEDSNWDMSVDALFKTDYWTHLRDHRGLTEETVRTYRLAYTGDGVRYPVYIYGDLCDIRTYQHDATPKMRSEKLTNTLLFPFDHWRKDDRPTLLCAGENDTMLARQLGYNAVTSTGGEGSFPKIFLPLFRGKTVYICYDCDEAGKKGARIVACMLRDVGAEVYLVDLGLPGTKEDKDLTDFIVKDNRSYAELDELIRNAPAYSSEQFVEDKNLAYPLVDLWKVHHGEYSGRRYSSRVTMAGKYDQPMEVPSVVEWECRGFNEESAACKVCALRKDKLASWALKDQNLDDLFNLVEVTPRQQANKLLQIAGIPEDCPGNRQTIKARKGVLKAIFTPDVATEDETSGFKAVEQYAYVLEKSIDNRYDLEDGQRYRIYFRRYAHPLQDQRIMLIVDKAEPSDNAMNMFHMTPQIMEQLKVFQGDPFIMMADRAKRHHALTVVFRPNELIANSVDIVYHSILRFKFNGREIRKGHPEIGIVGESRTGKTETAETFQKYIGVGNKVDLKLTSTAGLVGGADRLPNGGFRIKWGTLPRNHRGLVVLDEFSGAAREVISSLTAVRSSGVANVEKIASGKVPSETRLLWIANPRVGANGQSKPLAQYGNGVRIVLELVGSDEDVARFDALMVIQQGENCSPLDTPELEAHPAEVYRNLVYWAWTRNVDQVKFEEGVEKYIVQVADELNEKYNTDVKLFGGEAWKKLARIAVACASACFSCDGTGECILVGKTHVDWAANFLVRCYDNPVFRLTDYVKERRSFNETNEEINNAVAVIAKQAPIVMRTILDASEPIPSGTLQATSAMERNDYSKLLNRLSALRLVHVTDKGITATLRLRKAIDVYREEYKKSRMTPLIEEGNGPV